MGTFINAELTLTSLPDYLREHFAPAEKTQRCFSSPEVSSLLGMTSAHLRTLRHEGHIPSVGSENRRRATQFTAEDIWTIRESLETRARKKGRYLPGRRKGEPLQVLGVYSLKKGTSKTTLTATLAQYLALAGYKIGLIDLDPQASLSVLMGLNPLVELPETGTIYDAIRFDDSVPLCSVFKKTYLHNVHLAPASYELEDFVPWQDEHFGGHGQTPWYDRLSEAIASVEADYDIVLIDYPPSMTHLVSAALVASTGLLIPVVPSKNGVVSLTHFMRMLADHTDFLQGQGATVEHCFTRYVLARHKPTNQCQTQLAAVLRMHLESELLTSSHLESRLISDAHMSNQTIYDIRRSDVARSAYDRVRDSFDAVAAEVETQIHRAWGRV